MTLCHVLTVDDLPIIRDNIKKGWSTFVGKVKSKLEGEPEQPPMQPPRPGEYNYPRQSATRYDADPRVLGDDFSHLNIHDPSRRTSQTQSNRPLANPNLFKSTKFSNSPPANDISPPPKPPRPENQGMNPSSQSSGQPAGGPSPSKKWEPLRPAEDRDPFAVGDSDDDEVKDDLYGTASGKSLSRASNGQDDAVAPTSQDPAVGTPAKNT